MRRQTLYPMLGILLSLGAPLGLLFLSALQARAVPGPSWLAAQLHAEPLVYTYLMLFTLVVFPALGLVLGRYEDTLRSQSTTDPLTGLSNRRLLQIETDRELARASRYAVPVSLLLVDVDRLKLINDRRGHHAGDQALVAVATAIRQNLRIHDVAARYGGDEFAVLCPHTGSRDAQVLAERIRQAVQSGAGQGEPLSISIGIECVESSLVPDAERLFGDADRALYAAKEAGRNQTVAAS